MKISKGNVAIESQSDQSTMDSPRIYDGVHVYNPEGWSQPAVEPNDWTSRIADILLSENLVVLAGLGTSLSLNTDDHSIAPTMKDLWAMVSAIPEFGDVIKIVNVERAQGDVELLLSRCQLLLALDEDQEKVSNFIVDAETAICNRCSFPSPDHELVTHEMFLRKVARRSIRQPRMRLFTTNYDLCFERAAARAGFITIDGFGHSSPQIFDGAYFSYDFVKRDAEGGVPDFIPNVFQLLKLHGSTDWAFTEGGAVIKGGAGSRAMIYPRYGKFESSYQQPYFEMMARLQSALRQPNTGLLIIGYGARDKHINEPLLSAVRANVGLKLAIVDPVLHESEGSEVHRTLRYLVEKGDSRLLLISSTFQDFTTYIPDLVAETEQEAHFGRTSRR